MHESTFISKQHWGPLVVSSSSINVIVGDSCVWWNSQVPLQVILHTDHAEVDSFKLSDMTLCASYLP